MNCSQFVNHFGHELHPKPCHAISRIEFCKNGYFHLPIWFSSDFIFLHTFKKNYLRACNASPMNRLHDFVLRITNVYVWGFFFLAYLAMAGYFMPRAAQNLQNACGESVKIPDIEIGYNAAELREMVAFMDPGCRSEYLFVATVTDSFYPLIYGFFFLFSAVFVYYKNAYPFGMKGLYLVAPAATLSDFAENFTLGYIVRRGGELPDFAFHLASAFSMLKWLFALSGVLLLLLGVLRWVFWRFVK